MKWLSFFLFLLLIGLVSSFDVSNTTLYVREQNYTVYVNSTISLDRLFVTSSAISLYNLSSGGIFTNPNDTYDSVICFYNITSPKNDLMWDNTTTIFNITTLNITLPASRYFEILDNETIPPVVPPGGGGGGAFVNTTEQLICSMVYDFILENYESRRIDYITEQLINLTNEINLRTGSDFSSATIADYIVNYNTRCKGYQELPASIQFGLALESLREAPEEIWDKYNYEIIFFSILGVGIFGFKYLGKNKKKRRKNEKSSNLPRRARLP